MKFSAISRGLFSLAAFVICVAGLRAASPVIIPFLLASFIAVISSPVMVWLKKLGVRTGVSIAAILGIVIIALWLLVQITTSSIAQFAENADSYGTSLRQVTTDWIHWLEEKGIEVNDETFTSLVNPARAMTFVVRTLREFLQGFLTNTFMILVTVVFILLELAGLPNKLQMALGKDHGSIPALDRFSESINRYLLIKSWVSLTTGVCAFTLCRLVGVNYALLWGIIAFLLNYIPNIGSIVAAVPPVMLALVEVGTGKAAVVAGGYMTINIAFGNFIEPRLMGKGLGLSTLVVWMSLIFWGWVFGPIGMLLSVPLTMVVKIAMESKEETQWVAILLGSDPGESPQEEEPLETPEPLPTTPEPDHA